MLFFIAVLSAYIATLSASASDSMWNASAVSASDFVIAPSVSSRRRRARVRRSWKWRRRRREADLAGGGGAVVEKGGWRWVRRGEIS